MRATRNPAIPFILVVLFLDTLGVGVIIPVLPRLLAEFVPGNLGLAARYYGIFAASCAAMQFLCAPILGGLSDRFGRRPIILISLLGAGLDYVLLAVAPNLMWLFVGRVLAGVAGASFSAATAYIADVTPAEKRAQAFGLVGAAFGLGFIVGPALGGLLGGIHLRAPFVVSAALNLLNLLYGIFVLPESLRPENRRSFSFRRANPLSALANLGRSRMLIGLTGTLVCSFLAQQILYSTWALFTQARLGWTPVDVGLSLATVGISAAVIQGGLLKAIVQRIGERRAILVGMMFSAAGFIAFALASRGWMMYALIFPFALGGIAAPSTQALLSREVGSSEQGELQGTLSSLNSVAAILGALVGTALFARFSPETAVPHLPGASLLASAALNVLGFLLAARLFSKRT